MNTTTNENNSSRIVCGIDIQKDIIQRAESMGMCERWADVLGGAKNADMLAELYKRGIDFCVLHGWPSSKFVKSHVGKDTAEAHGIFVDTVNENRIGGKSGIFVIGGYSRMKFTFGKYTAATLHVIDSAEVDIRAEGNARVFLRIYDNAKVSIYSAKNSKASIIAYGEQCCYKIGGTEEVYVRRKPLQKSGSRKG